MVTSKDKNLSHDFVIGQTVDAELVDKEEATRSSERRRPNPIKEAVLCNNCPDLALARLNGVPLCLSCLMAAVKSDNEKQMIKTMNIKPLAS